MQRNKFRVLSFFVAIVLAVGVIPPRADAKPESGLTSKSKALIGTGVGFGALTIGGVIFLICNRSASQKIDSTTVSNAVFLPLKPVNNTSNENDLGLSLLSKRQIIKNLGYWLRSQNVMDESALEAALNIYSISTCGVKYKDLVEPLKKQQVGENSTYSDFYNVVCFNTGLGGDKHEYIKNICFFLKRRETSCIMWDFSEDLSKIKPFSDVANVIYSVCQTPPNQLPLDIAEELQNFKQGQNDLCID